MFPLAPFLKDVVQVVGDVVVGRLDLVRCPRGGGGCRRRAQIQDLERLGCGPGRWATADDIIPSSVSGVYFGSLKSQRAMGSFQVTVVVVFLDGGAGVWRRGGHTRKVHEESRDFDVIFLVSKVFSEVVLGQLALYPLRMCLYLYVGVHVLLV
jgi:hypothetical protein